MGGYSHWSIYTKSITKIVLQYITVIHLSPRVLVFIVVLETSLMLHDIHRVMPKSMFCHSRRFCTSMVLTDYEFCELSITQSLGALIHAQADVIWFMMVGKNKAPRHRTHWALSITWIGGVLGLGVWSHRAYSVLRCYILLSDIWCTWMLMWMNDRRDMFHRCKIHIWYILQVCGMQYTIWGVAIAWNPIKLIFTQLHALISINPRAQMDYSDVLYFVRQFLLWFCYILITNLWLCYTGHLVCVITMLDMHR